MLHGSIAAGAVVASGWQAARIPLAGAELAMTVVLPQKDVCTLLEALDNGGLAELLTTRPSGEVALTMPAFSNKSVLTLTETLRRMGMSRALSDSAQFGGLTQDEQLRIADVFPQGWVAVDKDGVEAAAATAVTVDITSAPPQPRLNLVLDRPFLYCVHDVELGLPLLIGVVNDPTQTGG